MSGRACALAIAWLTIAGRPAAADPAAPEFAHLNSPRTHPAVIVGVSHELAFPSPESVV